MCIRDRIRAIHYLLILILPVTYRKIIQLSKKNFREFSITKKDPDKNIGVERKILATCYSPTNELCSTLAAEALNFRVRYGNGCNLLAIITRKKVIKIINIVLSKQLL